MMGQLLPGTHQPCCTSTCLAIQCHVPNRHLPIYLPYGIAIQARYLRARLTLRSCSPDISISQPRLRHLPFESFFLHNPQTPSFLPSRHARLTSPHVTSNFLLRPSRKKKSRTFSPARAQKIERSGVRTHASLRKAEKLQVLLKSLQIVRTQNFTRCLCLKFWTYAALNHYHATQIRSR
jgi:hypothetical protein